MCPRKWEMIVTRYTVLSYQHKNDVWHICAWQASPTLLLHSFFFMINCDRGSEAASICVRRAAGQAERNVALAREEVERLKGQLTALQRSRMAAAIQSSSDTHTHGIDRHSPCHLPLDCHSACRSAICPK
jgi:hypothetical protein